MKFTINHWKDNVSHRTYFGRNAHLRDFRSWTLWVGKHCFTFGIHGLGPSP